MKTLTQAAKWHIRKNMGIMGNLGLQNMGGIRDIVLKTWGEYGKNKTANHSPEEVSKRNIDSELPTVLIKIFYKTSLRQT